MSTKAELRAMVVANIGNNTTKTTVINNALDLGLKEIGKLHSFSSMISTETISVETDDTSVALPTGTFRVFEARLINGLQSNEITIKSKKWVVDRYPNVSALAAVRPCLGYIENGSLYFSHPSDANYSIEATVGVLSSFASDSAENPIPELDFTLVCWATAFVFSSMQLFDFAAQWRSDFAISLRNAVSADKAMSPKLYVVDTSGNESKSESATPWLDPFMKG